ncbi:MAG: hypothetical protein WB988_16540 [Candidatus Nitrosopolaris sp.]
MDCYELINRFVISRSHRQERIRTVEEIFAKDKLGKRKMSSRIDDLKGLRLFATQEKAIVADNLSSQNIGLKGQEAFFRHRESD